MEAIFFIATTDEATGVTCVEDLPVDPVGEPLALQSPGPLLSLARRLGSADSPAIEPLRDATCRSFPVWSYPRETARALARLSDEDADRLADVLVDDPSSADLDADAYELATLLVDLREGLRAAEAEESLFVLLEEKAL